MNTDHESLKELVRTEPTIASTFADIDAEYSAAMDHAFALWGKRSELQAKLKEIADAKAQLSKEPRSEVGVEAEAEESADESSLLHKNVAEAKDRISRMRSAARLQQVVDTDQRSSVVEAAEKRLNELGDS